MHSTFVIRRYPSIYPPLPPPDFETKGGINTTFLADRSIMQKITPKKFRLRRAEKYMILLYFTCNIPKKFPPAAGKSGVFPLSSVGKARCPQRLRRSPGKGNAKGERTEKILWKYQIDYAREVYMMENLEVENAMPCWQNCGKNFYFAAKVFQNIQY